MKSNLLFILPIALIVSYCDNQKAVETPSVRESVLSFGADGTDKVEDTDAIQKTIDEVSKQGGGTVSIPKGTYLIDADKSVNLKSNITMEFEEGTVLKALKTNLEHYQIISIDDVENVTLKGPGKIEGERDEHEGNTGEWGFGLSINGSTNVHVENLTITDCWGDAIYLGSTKKQNYVEDVTIKDVVLDNNRRQGITLISAKDVEIINPVITNTKGTDPQSGIDFEPNYKSERMENIRVTNPKTSNNEGNGIQVYLGNIEGSKNPVGLYIDNTENITDGILVEGIENLTGEIDFGGVSYMSE
jgi:polygalacturonase